MSEIPDWIAKTRVAVEGDEIIFQVGEFAVVCNPDSEWCDTIMHLFCGEVANRYHRDWIAGQCTGDECEKHAPSKVLTFFNLMIM